jgi:adenosine deaminase
MGAQITMNPTIRNLPKVELHLHLDCCLSFVAVQHLAPGTTPEAFRRDFVAPDKCQNLADFLRTPAHHVALLQSEDALRLAVDDLFDQLVRDSVIYAEVRFAPLQHTQRGLRPEQVVAAVEGAVAKASTATGVTARIILCTLRHFTQAQSMETVRLVEQFRGTHVVALDIAGGEAGYPLDAHVAAFQYAVERGLPRTAHAGEACGPESVWEALRELQPARLGHGVRCIEDANLVAHLRATGVHLEVCPSSNVQTDVVPAYRDHPVDGLYRHGVSLGISTDARTVTDLTLATEYERLHETFGWEGDHFLAVNLNAIRAAFVSPSVRRDLEERLREQYRRL